LNAFIVTELSSVVLVVCSPVGFWAKIIVFTIAERRVNANTGMSTKNSVRIGEASSRKTESISHDPINLRE
jgi:hypothetical protein